MCKNATIQIAIILLIEDVENILAINHHFWDGEETGG